jgi:cysteinyl-tRNA synthetase
VLGIVPEEASAGNANAEREEGLIRLLIDLRAAARSARNFAEADTIRKRLTELGVTLEDRPDGTIWRVD